MTNRLIDVKARKIINLGTLFYLGANIYSILSQHFGPFKINKNVIKDELSIAGKVMAYAAYGKKNDQILGLLNKTYHQTIHVAVNENRIPTYPYLFPSHFIDKLKKLNVPVSYEDILTSIHYFLEETLTCSLNEKIKKIGMIGYNHCYCGGAALNIKWNSSIRKNIDVSDIWIPPFPNDSGSAIGMACCHYFNTTNHLSIDWNVYSGPKFRVGNISENWYERQCSIEKLALLIHHLNEPIIFIQEDSELGPRALGNRSILMNATIAKNRNVLNFIKYRESYRPIAPICLEEYSHIVFSPGGPDPYMLFEHVVNANWRDITPAVCHKDQTARLQTVNKEQNKNLYELLLYYFKVSRIPVLCNTSANLKGSGFFPNLESAIKWNKVNYICYNFRLYEKKNKLTFDFY